MDTTPTTDFQPWEAFVLDADGFVMVDEHVRGWAKAAAEDTYYDITDSEPNEIVIVRGTARPTPQSEGSDFLRAPSSWQVLDHLIPANDVSDDEPADVETRWDRARQIADAANKAAIQ